MPRGENDYSQVAGDLLANNTATWANSAAANTTVTVATAKPASWTGDTPGDSAVVVLVHNQDGTFDLRDYPGLYRRAPFLTVAMAVFLLSLMGIPPLVGFMGKLYVFAAVIEKGSAFYWFAVVGAVNAAIGAYYYARILKTMIIDPGNEEKAAFRLPFADAAWVAALLAANVLPLLWWGRVEGWARHSLGPLAGQ